MSEMRRRTYYASGGGDKVTKVIEFLIEVMCAGEIGERHFRLALRPLKQYLTGATAQRMTR